MTKDKKTALIDELVDKFGASKFFYLTDFSAMTVAETNDFRRKCFENQIEMRVIKNTLIQKSLERISDEGYNEVFPHLKGHTAVLFSEDGKTPAVVLKEFRKSSEKPLLKAAYIDQDVVAGDDQIDFLTELKSKADLLGELLTVLNGPASNLATALESPAKEMVGALSSSSSNLIGLLKAIGEKNN